MKEFLVTHVDADYGAPVNEFIMAFDSQVEADKWCQANRWSGGWYYATVWGE